MALGLTEVTGSLISSRVGTVLVWRPRLIDTASGSSSRVGLASVRWGPGIIRLEERVRRAVWSPGQTGQVQVRQQSLGKVEVEEEEQSLGQLILVRLGLGAVEHGLGQLDQGRLCLSGVEHGLGQLVQGRLGLGQLNWGRLGLCAVEQHAWSR